MIPALDVREPLSKVEFIHDYVRLHFQDDVVTILNLPELRFPSGESIDRNASGFCDALVALIGQTLRSATLNEGAAYTLVFASGVQLVVPLVGAAVRGPEAVELPHCIIIFNA